ncbi:MAG TPA: protealysin inhibitor emfourin [Candidatus Sulfotelmatobacter sp.]|nr:protealysin inhibitor emfourin [Candidatus Sulfotelmatobacter sp.]
MSRIRIERKGGFAGVPASGERDLQDLTAEQRAALDRLLKPSPEGAAASASQASPIHPFRYKVTLIDDQGERSFDVSEDAMPDELAGIAKVAIQ